ncbi:hypothetical protein SacmaDRAFT_5605 [Saccharomonospora marina XMU15]|uniref:DAGKc domain-containing protein n=1 Tax=Saccharomonospora marina XMU15 TaxID=882083 RepID=H5XA61_9PSEU|nr:hypothetical protein [Saccharomonospora marina]EHR53721.1 hypothetical protein SacmaDRAFT_5605 [Saccharomonospora marina XMU15]
MRGVVLACGDAAGSLPPAGQVHVEPVPARPGKADVDPLLSPALVVAGTDADLAAVVLRLLRKDLLAETTVGYVPTDPRSAVASLWRLPTNPERAMRLALTGNDRPVPLIRDDVGGVLIGRGELPRVRGIAYCDDTVALRGEARSVVVRPSEVAAEGLVVTVTSGRLRRRRDVFTSRAFQLGCDPLVPISDGVPHPRPMDRWTWYRHTEDLRLVRPSS